MSCGASPTGYKKFCRQCGVGLNPEQVVCVKCGTALTDNFGTNATATATRENIRTSQSRENFTSSVVDKIKSPLKPIIIAGGFFIALFLLLFLVGNIWQNDQLTPAEQAEVDVILTLYGRAALVNYLHYLERARRDVQGGGGLFGGDRRAFNINLRNKDPNLVLRYVENFIDQGVDVNAVSRNGWRPLDYAVKIGDARIVNHLIFNDAAVGQITLFRLAREGNVDMLRLFANPFVVYDLAGAREHNGDTLLHVARNVEVARFLVDNGVDVHATNNAGDTPLHSAASGGRLEVVQYLVSQEARVNVRNRRGQIPLDVARASNRTAVVEYLSGISPPVSNTPTTPRPQPTTTVSHRLATPVIQVSAIGSNAIRVRWNPVSNARSYVINYTTDSALMVVEYPTGALQRRTIRSPATSIDITGLSPNTTYYVRVMAIGDWNPYHNSDHSTVQSVTTDSSSQPATTSTTTTRAAAEAATVRVPISQYFSTQDRLALLQIQNAVNLFRATHDRLPVSHEEFMTEIIRANNIQLPQLPDGHTYMYEGGELKVRRPAP